MLDLSTFDWNDIYTGEAVDLEPPDALMLELIDSLPGHPDGGRRALDVGCGAGGLLVALAERGYRVTGIDIASKAIAAARKVTGQRGFDVELTVADATRWQPDRAYDLVTSCFAVPGKRRRAAALAMMRAALAPGGVVLLKDFDTSMARLGYLPADDLVEIDELTAAFAGFEIIRAELVDTPVHDHDGSGKHAGERWTAAILCARKPADGR